MIYRVLDPCFEGDNLVEALETELNALAAEGWRVVAVVPVRGFRLQGDKVQVSDDSVDALVLEKKT